MSAVLGMPLTSDQTFSEVGTDTRSLKPGALFVALAGDNFDGHDYLGAAAKAGGKGAVVKHGTAPTPGIQYFEVDDPLVALGKLAHARRAEIKGPVVAVTGTNGKTSTKEMLRAVLGNRWTTHATKANQNNLIGVPLTILGAPPATEALIVEAGTNEIGEIARLRTIIEPTAAVVTNVSAGHLAGFGSVGAVMSEKIALLENVPLAVCGTVPSDLPAEARRLAPVSCSAALEAPADVTPSHWTLGADGKVTLTFRGHKATLGPPGKHQGDNAMLALALGEALGLETARMADALSLVAVPAGRSTLIQKGDLLIVDDTYNANPGSVRASLDLAATLRGRRPFVVVLGSMLELGSQSDQWHTDVARDVIERSPDLIVGCGEFIPPFEGSNLSAGRFVAAADVADVVRILNERLTGNELVLLKASRGIQLDRAIPLIAPVQGD